MGLLTGAGAGAGAGAGVGVGVGVRCGACVNRGAPANVAPLNKNSSAAAVVFNVSTLKRHFEVDMSVPPTELLFYLARVCFELLHRKP